MRCKYCEAQNDEDAVFCKKCGNSFYQEKPKKQKKIKKKVKKVNKKITKVKKEKQKKSFGQKLLIMLMIIILVLLLGLLGLIGYDYYKNQNIEVPNVVGLTYDEAVSKLNDHGLKVIKKEIETENVEDEGIILKQNKKEGTKVSKNTKIKLSMGILKQYSLPDLMGKDIDEVRKLLDQNNIKYKIVYEEDQDEDKGVVTSQIPDKGSKVTISDVVTIMIGKEKQEEPEKNSSSDDQEEKNNKENETQLDEEE